jgi:hypothetical protein
MLFVVSSSMSALNPFLRRKLKELMFSRTQVTGTIPNEIGDLTAIENLEMYGNFFTGVIPFSLGNCTNLKRIGKGYLTFV